MVNTIGRTIMRRYYKIYEKRGDSYVSSTVQILLYVRKKVLSFFISIQLISPLRYTNAIANKT